MLSFTSETPSEKGRNAESEKTEKIAQIASQPGQ
jgi:hypothetical protein